MRRKWWLPVLALVFVLAVAAKLASAQPASDPRPQPAGATTDSAATDKHHHAQATILVPDTDRFSPFETTVFEGDQVDFVNQDTDDHTIVSDDAVNDGGPRGIDIVLHGTDSNGGQPGKVSLVFGRPGTWVFYCRFHSHLGDDHQPVAPGPKGGIQDASGNFGVPMTGIVHVKSRSGNG